MSLVRSGIGVLVVKVAGMLAAFVLAIVLARFLGPAGFGVYSFAYAIVGVLALPSQAGLPVLITREIADFGQEQRWGKVRGLWLWSRKVAVFTSSACVLFILAWWAMPFGLSPERRAAILWVAPLIPLLAISALQSAALRGLRRTAVSLLPTFVVRPLLLTLAVAIIALLANERIAPGIALALHGLAALVATLLGYFLLRSAWPVALDSFPSQADERPIWFRALLGLSAVAGLQLILQYFDILLLASFSSDESVGFFRVAATVAVLASFGITALNLTLQPYISRALKDRSKSLYRMMAAASWSGFAVALAFLLVVYFYGHEFIKIFFGEQYLPALPALIILAFGRSVAALFGPTEVVLMMSGNERVAFRALLLTVVITLILGIALVPRYELFGAAITSSVAIVLWNFLYWRAVRNKLEIDVSVASVLRLSSLSTKVEAKGSKV